MKLLFISGPLNNQRFEVTRDITIGRDESNDIPFSDPSVSLVHAQIYFDGSAVYIKDLGSTNGTQVNNEKIINFQLRHGDEISLGQNRMRVDLPHSGQTPAHIDPAAPPSNASETSSFLSSKDDLSGNIAIPLTYYLKRKIANGGMGAIYEAEQMGAEGFIKKVAIKTILPEFVQKKTFVSSFIGEAKLVANLVHQNIVQIHHLGRHEDGYFIAMEFIDGINLTNFMLSHQELRITIPMEIATFIVSRICRGLEYAHEKKDAGGNSLHLVHRDVSPNNIMITTEGEVKLTDFGVAKANLFMEDDSGYLVGSVEYMSPEQANCDPVDARSDLFSLGLVYHEMACSRRVFQCVNEDIYRTVEQVKECVIPDPVLARPDIPGDMRRIIQKALKKSLTERYQSASEMVVELEQSIYSKGYGPTTRMLADYIKELGRKKQP